MRTAHNLDNTFRALAVPARRAVLERLAKGRASVSTLAEPFDMALPSFMQHLDVLEKGGLVRSKKVGRVRTYELAPQRLAQVARWLDVQRALWETRMDQFDDYVTSLHNKEKHR